MTGPVYSALKTVVWNWPLRQYHTVCCRSAIHKALEPLHLAARRRRCGPGAAGQAASSANVLSRRSACANSAGDRESAGRDAPALW